MFCDVFMVAPRLRSNTLREVKKKTPGGKVTVHYEPKKPSKSKCAACGRPLHGTPRLRPSLISKLSKTEKRPERPYGGYLCSSCMRELIKIKVRGDFE